MNLHQLIIQKAIEEIETKSHSMTAQFLEIHKIAYTDNEPKIARVDTSKKDEATVYFNVEGVAFFFAVYLDVNPTISVKWADSEPYHSVYFRASSKILSLNELKKFTKLISDRGRNKGDKRMPEFKKDVVWAISSIDFEPNPEPEVFEEKLAKLLDYLEQDKVGVEKLVKDAGGYIQVYTEFHNGNTLIGGHHINKDHINRMSKLDVAIDFDIRANGNFFK
jgi:hypothetical protein